MGRRNMEAEGAKHAGQRAGARHLPPPRVGRGSWQELALRGAFLVLALLSLWLAIGRLDAFSRATRETFSPDTLKWLATIGLAILSGILVGLAVWPLTSWPGSGYRWGPVLVLSTPVLALLLHRVFLLAWVFPRPRTLPILLSRETPFTAPPAQFALAIMLGVILIWGFMPSSPPENRRVEGER